MLFKTSYTKVDVGDTCMCRIIFILQLTSAVDLPQFNGYLMITMNPWMFWGSKLLTLPKTNIDPENGPSQKKTSIPAIHFQVLC